DSVCPAVHKESHRHIRTDQRNAVLEIAVSLKVPAGQGSHISEHRNGKRTHGSARRRIVIRNSLRSRFRNECHRRNGTDVEATDIALSPHVKPAERGYFFARKAGRVRRAEMKTYNIAALSNGMEIFHVEDIGNAVDVAAKSGHPDRIEETLAACGIDRMVDGVIGNRRSDGAG